MEETSDGLLPRWMRSTALLFLAALVVRLAFLVVQAGPSDFALAGYGDDRHYHDVAVNIVEGDGIAWKSGEPTAWHPPLVYFYVAALYAVFGVVPLAVYLANVALLSLAPLLAKRLGSRWFGERIGTLGAWICVAWPPLVFSVSRYQKEALVIPLVLVALLLWSSATRDPRRWKWLLLGLAFAVTALARAEFALGCVLFGGWILLRLRAVPREALIAAVLFALPSVLLIGPWIARNHQQLDAFVPIASGGGYTFYATNHDDALLYKINHPAEGAEYVLGAPNEVERSRRGREQAVEWVRENPGRWARNALVKCWYLWGPVPYLEALDRQPGVVRWLLVAANLALLLPAYLLLVAGSRLGVRRPVELLLFMLQVTVVAVLFWSNHRLRAPLDAPLVLCAVAAVIPVVRSWRSRRAPSAG